MPTPSGATPRPAQPSAQPSARATSRRRVLRSALAGSAAVAASTLLAGCISDDDSGAPTGTPGAPGDGFGGKVADAVAAASASPSSGGRIAELRVGLPGALTSLYPGREAGYLNFLVANCVLEGLVRVGPDGVLHPALASDVRHTDNETWAYTLRDKVVFHDGSKLNVDAVLHSIVACQDPLGSPATADRWTGFYYAKQTDTAEVTIAAATGDPAYAWTACNAYALWIAPRARWHRDPKTGMGTPKTLLTGTGPYRVTAFKPGSGGYVELTRFAQWWGPSPKVDRIRFLFLPDDTARMRALESGALHLALDAPVTGGPAAAWQTAGSTAGGSATSGSAAKAKSRPRPRVAWTPDLSFTGLVFDTTAVPFDDPHVRRAIGYALDPAAAVRTALGGHAQQATAFSTPEQFAPLWTSAQATAQLAAVPQYGRALSRARAELAASKHPHGFTTSLAWPQSVPQLGVVASQFAASLAGIGIVLKTPALSDADWAAVQAAQLAGTAAAPAPGGAAGRGGDGTTATASQPLAFLTYTCRTGDPGELPLLLLGTRNPAGYRSRPVQSLIAKAAVQPEPVTRNTQLISAQQHAAADAPYLPLWWGRSGLALAPGIGLRDCTAFSLVSGTWPLQTYPVG